MEGEFAGYDPMCGVTLRYSGDLHSASIAACRVINFMEGCGVYTLKVSNIARGGYDYIDLRRGNV